eukprot:gene21332-28234_t
MFVQGASASSSFTTNRAAAAANAVDAAVPIGDESQYEDAHIYPEEKVADTCEKGKLNPSARAGCAGWNASWTEATCLSAGCCYNPITPDPQHYGWCYAKGGSGGGPKVFYTDTDIFIATTDSDPQTTFVDQGWWGQNDHCVIKGNNNAAAVLMPDNVYGTVLLGTEDAVTLVQFQPLYRCSPGSPVLSLSYFLRAKWSNVSILGGGANGAHGGSHLSSIGGTIRKGELNSTASPIRPVLLKMSTMSS